MYRGMVMPARVAGIRVQSLGEVGLADPSVFAGMKYGEKEYKFDKQRNVRI